MSSNDNSEEMTSKDYYFDSYSHFGIHEEMLKDDVRTLAYRNAIYRNRELFEGKVVLDVGCGTGILCMFAASAGARLVIGVDMSGIIDKARQIVLDNGFGPDRIVLLKGKMEEVCLPVPQVDIIISEWMGYFLLYESMLDTVIWARDRYLAPGGHILPDRASMIIAGIEDGQYKQGKIHFWDNVYGFNMGCIKEVALREPLVDVVEADAVVTSEAILRQFDLRTVRKEDLTFVAPFELEALRTTYMHAFLVYFDIEFAAGRKPVRFSTGPAHKYTHWKQTVLYLQEEELNLQGGNKVNGQLSCRPNDRNPRDLDISITFHQTDGGSTVLVPEQTHNYHMC